MRKSSFLKDKHFTVVLLYFANRLVLCNLLFLSRNSLVPQIQRICLPVQKMWIGSLGREDPLEKGMATHSSALAWKTPWTDHRITKSLKRLSN